MKTKILLYVNGQLLYTMYDISFLEDIVMAYVQDKRVTDVRFVIAPREARKFP